MRRTAPDLVALLLAVAAVVAGALVADRVFERIPHLEDEFAFLWQAEVMAEGRIWLPSPPEPRSFLVPFVVDYEGRRFGKYPPGWPAALALGAYVDLPWLVNPLLGGLAVWLVYRLGSRVAGRGVGLVAALLTATSPAFLMLSGSLMGHNLGLVLGLGLALAWLGLFPGRGRRRPRGVPPWLLVAVAGLSLGLLALTRPLTAVGVGLPFGLHGLWLLVRGGRRARRRVLAVGGLALAVAALLPLWQWALTGNPWLSPYTLWWPYDKVGFGPGVGRMEGGHNLFWAYHNTRFSLSVGVHDLFGWPHLSWLFLPFGLLALRRNRDGWLVFATFPALVLVYLTYWIGSWLLSPRYYYESLPGLAVTSAAGVAWLAGWARRPRRQWARLRNLAVSSLLLVLLSLNAAFYLPLRVGGLYSLYNIRRERMRPLEQAGLQRALVFVHYDHWTDYGTLLTLSPPFRGGELLLVFSRGASADRRVMQAFPDLPAYHYDPDEPGVLYPARGPEGDG